MPIYEYECGKCGVVFEMMQSISAKPLKTCEGAGCNGKVRRLVSASGFILKGTGWYATDYPSEARKKGYAEEANQGKPTAEKPPAGESAPSASGGPAESASAPTKETAPPPAAKPKGPKSPYAGSKSRSKGKPKKSK